MTVVAAKLIALEQPRIIDTGGVPELYCDLALVRDFEDMVRLYLCRRMASRAHDGEHTALIHMPRRGFMASLDWAATQFPLPKH